MINILFICIGNSCRSQMAEGFARKYGSDVLHVWSAGTAPAPIVQPETVQIMLQKNIDIQEQFPKSMYELDLNSFDLLVNMSGQVMPVGMRGEIVTWQVADPMSQPEEVYIAVRDKIESLVMQLIMDVRRKLKTPPPPVATPVKPVKNTESAQRFGFGRVRKNRD